MKFFLIIAALAMWLNGFPQKRDFEWYASAPQTSIPENLQNEDAVQILKQISFDYISDKKTSITWIDKIKIQSKKGLERYNRTYIHASLYPYLETFSARIIKPDNSTRELEKSDIIVEGISNNRDEEYYNYAKYMVKGLEVGDELETIYIINYNGIFYGADVSLGSDLYTLKSVLSITNFLDMGMDITSNGHPIKFTNGNGQSLGKVSSWEKHNLSPEKREVYSIPTRTIPYCSFAPYIESFYNSTLKGVPFEWTELASKINGYYGKESINAPTSKYLRSNADWWGTETAFKLRLVKMIDFINAIPYKKLDKETHYSLTDYHEKQEIDNDGRIAFMMAFLEHENVPFDIGFTRDKYDGSISTDLPNFYQLDRLFFCVNFNGEELFVFPSQGKLTLHLNEIPALYEGNNALLVQKTEPHKIQTIKFIQLPVSGSEFNTRSSRSLLKLNFNDNIISLERKDKNSGAFSYNARWNRAYYSENEHLDELGYDSTKVERLEITQTAAKPFFPAEMELALSFDLKQSLTPIDGDTVFAINLANVVTPLTFKESEELRQFDFYPPYIFKDMQSIYIQSEKPVKVINKDELERDIQNSFGIFTFKINQVNPNIIKVDCLFRILKAALPANEYGQYKELMAAIKKLRAAKLIISTSS